MFSNKSNSGFFTGHRYQNKYGWGYKPKYGPTIESGVFNNKVADEKLEQGDKVKKDKSNVDMNVDTKVKA